MKKKNIIFLPKIDPITSNFTAIEGIRNSNQTSLETNSPFPIHKNLFSLVYDINSLTAAYTKLYKNKGALTAGPSGSTADGTSLISLQNLSKSLKEGTFSFNPVKRILIPKPGKSTKRPLGIPDFDNKIVQESIRMVLNAIYEPEFQKLNCSFGFRSKLSSHDAIDCCKAALGATHGIEGDIVGAFNYVNHNKLLDILQRRIQDTKFLNLIKQGLKSGIIFEKVFEETNVGTTQGSSLSPLLFNIYMHELDKYITYDLSETIYAINKRKNRKPRTLTTKYNKLRYRHSVVRNFLSINPNINAISDPTIKHQITLYQAEDKRLTSEKLKTPYTDKSKTPLQYQYVRFADDWILLLSGTKTEATYLKNKIASFLKYSLFLSLSPEKTKITILNETKASFLGFSIYTSRHPHIQKTSSSNLQRITGRQICISIDTDRLINSMFLKKYCTKSGEPTHNPIIMVLKDHEIITKYNQIMVGMANYFYRVVDRTSYINRIHYILYYSCLKTLAARHKTSITQITNTLGYKETNQNYRIIPRKNLRIVSEYTLDTNKGKITKYSILYSLSELHLIASKIAISIDINQDLKKLIRNDFLNPVKFNMRTSFKLSSLCVICGSEKDLQSHHVKHIRKDKVTGFTQILRQLNRKQIVVCHSCHQLIHTGKYDGLSLTDISHPELAQIENHMPLDESHNPFPTTVKLSKSNSTPIFEILSKTRSIINLSSPLRIIHYERDYKKRISRYYRNIIRTTKLQYT